MKKTIDRIFGSPSYLSNLLRFARWGTAVQVLFATVFAVLSRNDGPLGCLALAKGLGESALVTLTLGICIRIIVSFLRKSGWNL